MIVAECDASVDLPIVSVGYVLYETQKGNREFLDSGTRVLNANHHNRNIEWSTQSAEYFGAIIAVRAALDYSDDVLFLNMDEGHLVSKIRNKQWTKEQYFEHCFYSFANRFDNWHINTVHREQNEAAHEQARVGLKVGRDLHEGTV